MAATVRPTGPRGTLCESALVREAPRSNCGYLSAPPALLLERIRRRAMEDPPLQKSTINGWFDTFEAQTEEELALYDAPTG